jgi:hypothetical protein
VRWATARGARPDRRKKYYEALPSLTALPQLLPLPLGVVRFTADMNLAEGLKLLNNRKKMNSGCCGYARVASRPSKLNGTMPDTAVYRHKISVLTLAI